MHYLRRSELARYCWSNVSAISLVEKYVYSFIDTKSCSN